MNYKKAVENIRNELRNYLFLSDLKSLVIGVSGGIDSALCLALARPVCDKMGIKLIGRSIPISTNKEDEQQRAISIGSVLCHDFDVIKNLDSYDTLVGDTNLFLDKDGWRRKIRDGNIKARLRMIILYDLAQLNKGMVLSTDNYTEFLLGFWTLHGDVGDYGMIQRLWKTEVYDMAEYLVNSELKDEVKNIMILTIKANATDGLGITNTDLDQILPEWRGDSRTGYAKVDMILKEHFETGIGDLDSPVLQRYYRTNFKRENPYNIPRENIEHK